MKLSDTGKYICTAETSCGVVERDIIVQETVTSDFSPILSSIVVGPNKGITKVFEIGWNKGKFPYLHDSLISKTLTKFLQRT